MAKLMTSLVLPWRPRSTTVCKTYRKVWMIWRYCTRSLSPRHFSGWCRNICVGLPAVIRNVNALPRKNGRCYLKVTRDIQMCLKAMSHYPERIAAATTMMMMMMMTMMMKTIMIIRVVLMRGGKMQNWYLFIHQNMRHPTIGSRSHLLLRWRLQFPAWKLLKERLLVRLTPLPSQELHWDSPLRTVITTVIRRYVAYPPRLYGLLWRWYYGTMMSSSSSRWGWITVE